MFEIVKIFLVSLVFFLTGCEAVVFSALQGAGAIPTQEERLARRMGQQELELSDKEKEAKLIELGIDLECGRAIASKDLKYPVPKGKYPPITPETQEKIFRLCGKGSAAGYASGQGLR
jgi:hypothetical protein